MSKWLMKSEPGCWSWDQQAKCRDHEWKRVRNAQAANSMRAMKKGDHSFFYHSVSEKQVVGIVEIVREWLPDHDDPSGKLGTVKVKAVKPLSAPVTLADIKADDRLADLALVRQSRLSVMPVDAKSWKIIC